MKTYWGKFLSWLNDVLFDLLVSLLGDTRQIIKIQFPVFSGHSYASSWRSATETRYLIWRKRFHPCYLLRLKESEKYATKFFLKWRTEIIKLDIIWINEKDFPNEVFGNPYNGDYHNPIILWCNRKKEEGAKQLQKKIEKMLKREGIELFGNDDEMFGEIP